MDIKSKTCCFTGHKQIPPGQYSCIAGRLENEIIKLINAGVRHFYVGGALGFDTLAALTLLDLRKKHPQIRLVLVVPCLEQYRGWSEDNKKTYHLIWKKVDKVIYTDEDYRPGCVHLRNRKLVNSSDFCICYLRKPTGGTAYTVEYAKKKGLDVVNLAESL